MRSVARSLVSQLRDMQKKFEAMEDSYEWDDGWKWTDRRSYQNFDKLTKDCVELFNEAERFLAERHPAYRRKPDLDKMYCKTPLDYAGRCADLKSEVKDEARMPVLPLIPNHPQGWRDIDVILQPQNAYLCQI